MYSSYVQSARNLYIGVDAASSVLLCPAVVGLVELVLPASALHEFTRAIVPLVRIDRHRRPSIQSYEHTFAFA
jgi:hypothetical protein